MTYAETIKAALAAVGVPYFHDEAHKQSADYIVWKEKDLSFDNGECVLVRLEVHFYTKQEYSTIPAVISDALKNAGFTGVNSALRDRNETTGVTHFVITCMWSATGSMITVNLIARDPRGSNEYGTPIWGETSREVIAEITEIKWSELYAALAAGFKPQFTLLISAADYQNEKVVEINGVQWQITSAKTTDSGKYEIVCSDTAKAG